MCDWFSRFSFSPGTWRLPFAIHCRPLLTETMVFVSYRTNPHSDAWLTSSTMNGSLASSVPHPHLTPFVVSSSHTPSFTGRKRLREFLEGQGERSENTTLYAPSTSNRIDTLCVCVCVCATLHTPRTGGTAGSYDVTAGLMMLTTDYAMSLRRGLFSFP